MIAESRKRNRIFFAFIQNLIITISYNAAKCFVKSGLILGITKTVDEDEICVSTNYRLTRKPYFFLILFSMMKASFTFGSIGIVLSPAFVFGVLTA